MKMFSENNRISVRQAVRNYGMMVISISALVIPVAMNHTAMPSVLLAAGLLGIYSCRNGCGCSTRKIEYSRLHHMSMAGYWGH